MNQAWEKVREFHEKFEVPYEETPKRLAQERIVKRAEWMREEIEELVVATSITEQADAMIDIIYFALGTLVEMGVRPEVLFQIVHEANISKCWEDGMPRFREEDGKVIKPPNWQDPAPLLQTEIERQKKGRL